MKIVKLTDNDILELERIIIDEDQVEALKFIKLISESIKEEDRNKLKSHLESSNPVNNFRK